MSTFNLSYPVGMRILKKNKNKKNRENEHRICKKFLVFVNPVSSTSKSSSKLAFYKNHDLCTSCFLVRCCQIIIEEDTETCRKLKKYNLKCRLIIFIDYQNNNLISVKLMTLLLQFMKLLALQCNIHRKQNSYARNIR